MNQRKEDRSMGEDNKGSGQPDNAEKPPTSPPKPKEIGGPKGPEPTRYGDWERNGRCCDF
jgi:hypothetical protein